MVSDTDPASEKVWIDLWRSKTPGFRLRRAVGLSAQAVALSRQGLSRRHPELAPRERDLLWVELHYGRELAEKVRQHLERG